MSIKRKVYSVSVPIESDLYQFLEQNRNNSKFFIEAAEKKLQDDDGDLLSMIKSLMTEVAELKKMVSNGVTFTSRKSIGDKRPEIRRGRRDG